MTRVVFFIGLAIALSVTEMATAFDVSKLRLEDRRDMNGVRRVVHLDRYAAEKLPQWQPAKGAPPLGVDVSLAAVVKDLKAQNAKIDDVQLREISLKTFRDSSIPDRWYYVFDFDPIVDGNRLFGAMYFGVVLMDGTVLLPEVTASGDGAEQ